MGPASHHQCVSGLCSLLPVLGSAWTITHRPLERVYACTCIQQWTVRTDYWGNSRLPCKLVIVVNMIPNLIQLVSVGKQTNTLVLRQCHLTDVQTHIFPRRQTAHRDTLPVGAVRTFPVRRRLLHVADWTRTKSTQISNSIQYSLFWTYLYSILKRFVDLYANYVKEINLLNKLYQCNPNKLYAKCSSVFKEVLSDIMPLYMGRQTGKHL